MIRLEKAIFDMDGLIFDTENLFMNEQKKALEKRGYTLTREKYVQTLGLTGTALSKKLKSLFGEDYPEKEVTAEVRSELGVIAETEGLPVKRGIRELIGVFKENGIPCVIASSTHTKYIEKYLKTAGLDGCFSEITGGECVKNSKPAPDIFIKAAGKTNPENTVVFEDSMNGIKAAYAAGMPVICIPDMVEPDEETRKLTYAVASNAEEAADMIRRML